MTLKYILEGYKFTRVPRYIFLAVLSFIHETVYGFGTCVPETEDEWIFYFSIRMQKYDMLLSLEYLLSILSERSQTRSVLNTIKMISFLADKPDISTLQKFMASENGNIRKNFGLGFDLVFKTLLINFDESVVNGLGKMIQDIEFSKFFAKELIVKLHVRNSERLLTLANSPRFKGSWVAHFIRQISRSNPPTDGISYILSRSYLRPFSIEELLQFPSFDSKELACDVLKLKMPFLLQFDILSKMLRSGILEMHLAPQSVNSNFFHNSVISKLPIYELIFDEAPPGPFNFFDQIGYAKNSANLDNFSDSQLKRTLERFDDPLGVVFFLGTLIEKFNSDLGSSFDLNVKYHFDGDFSGFALGIFSKELLMRLQGQILSFREILLLHLKNQTLIQAFQPLGIDDPKEYSSFPIISLSNFFNRSSWQS